MSWAIKAAQDADNRKTDFCKGVVALPDSHWGECSWLQKCILWYLRSARKKQKLSRNSWKHGFDQRKYRASWRRQEQIVHSAKAASRGLRTTTKRELRVEGKTEDLGNGKLRISRANQEASRSIYRQATQYLWSTRSENVSSVDKSYDWAVGNASLRKIKPAWLDLKCPSQRGARSWSKTHKGAYSIQRATYRAWNKNGSLERDHRQTWRR